MKSILMTNKKSQRLYNSFTIMNQRKTSSIMREDRSDFSDHKKQSFTLEELISKSMEIGADLVNKENKTTMTQDQVEKLVTLISTNLGVSPERVIIGIYLLFLKGAASAGTPVSMSVEIEKGKILDKRTLMTTCKLVADHEYIRRIAEYLAGPIGQFAQKHGLNGELATRINNRLKAETGQSLTPVEMAYCSSFSQTIVNLDQLCGSTRLGQLLAEDYQKRFDTKKKASQSLSQEQYLNKGVKKNKRKK